MRVGGAGFVYGREQGRRATRQRLTTTGGRLVRAHARTRDMHTHGLWMSVCRGRGCGGGGARLPAAETRIAAPATPPLTPPAHTHARKPPTGGVPSQRERGCGCAGGAVSGKADARKKKACESKRTNQKAMPRPWTSRPLDPRERETRGCTHASRVCVPSRLLAPSPPPQAALCVCACVSGHTGQINKNRKHAVRGKEKGGETQKASRRPRPTKKKKRSHTWPPFYFRGRAPCPP